MNLIPTKISKSNGQKSEWNSFWDNSLLQRVINITRRYNVWLDLSTILKDHKYADTFCEIGCGSSILLMEVAKTAKKVVGIDYSPQSIRTSQRLFREHGIKNYELIRSDIRRPTKRRFDIVYSNGLVEHFEDPGKIVYNHVLLTKKNGYAIISVPYRYSTKNIWFKLTRPKPLRRFWLWTDQLFFTESSLKDAYLRYAKKSWKYEIKTSHLTENVILKVRNC